MKPLQRTLAIVASLFLAVQTVRHAYVLWLEPRVSVLDRFDRPLKDDIEAADSVDDLFRRYEPVRQDVDRIKAERRAADPKARFTDEEDAEPFKSEAALRSAIVSWEQRAKEIHALHFYWFVGLAFAGIGVGCYLAGRHWLGVTLLIIGFSEIIYWTTPTFLFGGASQEFDRLVGHKLGLSVASAVLLGLVIRVLGVFEDSRKVPA
jgi:hypothetical protein